MRVLHMRHQRDSRGPEPRILCHARHTTRRHCLLGGLAQSTVYFGDVDTHLLEHAAAPKHAHQAAPRVRSVFTRAPGFRHFKAARSGI